MKHILLSSLFVAGVASAATFQVDFGNQPNTSTTGWNNMVAASITGLVDSTGTATGIDIGYAKSGVAGLSGVGANYDSSDTGWAGYPATLVGLGIPDTALKDNLFFAQENGTITFTITGLDSSLTYNFLIYGARGNNGSVDTTYTITGSNSGFANIGSVLNNNDDYADIQGIAPLGDTITVVATSINGVSNNGGAINMMTFTSVPEPASLSLLALACSGLLRRHR